MYSSAVQILICTYSRKTNIHILRYARGILLHALINEEEGKDRVAFFLHTLLILVLHLLRLPYRPKYCYWQYVKILLPEWKNHYFNLHVIHSEQHCIVIALAAFVIFSIPSRSRTGCITSAAWMIHHFLGVITKPEFCQLLLRSFVLIFHVQRASKIFFGNKNWGNAIVFFKIYMAVYIYIY